MSRCRQSPQWPPTEPTVDPPVTSSVVALVPARSGSKRIPAKNVRRLAGHPLIAFTIATALQSDIFDSVVVSTDSEETATMALYYGAEVPGLRPDELASDTSPDVDWVRFTLAELERMDRHYDAFSILRPTSPLRQVATIRRAWTEFRSDPDADSLRAVELCRQHPGKMWRMSSNRLLPLLDDGGASPPWHSRPYQALPAVYVQNASLEIARTGVVTETGTISGREVRPFMTQGYEGFDLNDASDWWLLESLLAEGVVVLPEVHVEPFPPSPPSSQGTRE